MLLTIWIVLGLIAGLVASRLFPDTGGALLRDLAVGVAGAIAGGLAFDSLGFPQNTVVAVAGSLGAALGSAVALGSYRAIFRPV